MGLTVQLGILSDVNLAPTAAISGPEGGASVLYPLANMLKEEDYIGRPTRFPAAGELGLTRFDLVLPEPYVLSVFGLIFHTMSLAARYRVTGTTLDDPTFAAPTLQTGWRWVFPSIYDPVELPFGVENGFTGTVTQAEVDLLGRHLAATLPEALVERLRVELDDQEHPLGWFDVGGLILSAGFSPEMNFDRGRDLSVIPRDLRDEAPSGRIFPDPRTPRRVLNVSYSNLTDGEARRFVDSAMRSRSIGTVLFIPNLDDPAATMREAFPATYGKPPGARTTYPGLGATNLTLEEVLA